MIQINLLPGARFPAHSRATSFVRQIFSVALASAGDAYLPATIATVAVVTLTAAVFHHEQTTRVNTLAQREVAALRDSARHGLALGARAHWQATRDSLDHQLAVIGSIDDSRYRWARLLEQISIALPQRTWLTSITQTSVPAAIPVSDSAAKNVVGASAMSFRIAGQTMDLQSLTLFMKALESSPHIENVQLARSDLVVVEEQDVTQFQLVAESESPKSLLRPVALPAGAN